MLKGARRLDGAVAVAAAVRVTCPLSRVSTWTDIAVDSTARRIALTQRLSDELACLQAWSVAPVRWRCLPPFVKSLQGHQKVEKCMERGASKTEHSDKRQNRQSRIGRIEKRETGVQRWRKSDARRE